MEVKSTLNPFALSLPKGCSFPPAFGKGQGFDTLSPNGFRELEVDGHD
jgi:hypothetical protein